MNRIARRGLIALAAGTALVGATLLGAGVGGAALAGTNWDSTPATVAGTAWDNAAPDLGRTDVGALRRPSGWAGPTVVLAEGRGKPTFVLAGRASRAPKRTGPDRPWSRSEQITFPLPPVDVSTIEMSRALR